MTVSKTARRRVCSSVTSRMALLAAFALPLAADPLSDVFAKIDKAAAGFKGMTASVSQTVHDAIVNEDSVESGNVKLRRSKPGDTRIYLEFTTPNPEIVSLEGDEFRRYMPKTNVVQVVDLRSRRGALEQGLLLGFGSSSTEIQASYDVSWVGAETVDGQPTGHIRLVPKSKEVLQSIRQADLWISNATGSPVQQRVVTSGKGDYIQMTYSGVKINPSLSDKDLRLNPRKGFQIQQVGK